MHEGVIGAIGVIAITQGDPAGIGPEIIVQAFRDHPKLLQHCLVVGDVVTMRRATRIVAGNAIPIPLAVLEHPAQAMHCPAHCIPIWPPQGSLAQAMHDPAPLGQPSAQSGHWAGECVVWATNAALRGDVAAVVTAPLHKAAMAMAGPPYNAYPGHTEMLQELAAIHLQQSVAEIPVRMMLVNDVLRVVLHSTHLSLRDAIRAVTRESVVQSLLLTHQWLPRLLGRPPRIAVAGLNPHAGEEGLFGREEIDVLVPAIEDARRLGVAATGPYSPDTVFMRARTSGAGEFDVVLAMYHDQGLIPLKYLGLERGVNITLGLPIVRTSPDHGTAMGLAGRGVADATSLVEAVRIARLLCAHPLPGAVG
ncbi:4-hydroxythreonine-4-phosphate dehydrogenase PdxA [Candidatus Symbiobacter mobilis]|uniref:4-hydroxythreonine-4-phosphate dehydrogenase n=1 Tax=Candidatus Symbiobacter mobilis CR TaxID=946483 RepID=U5N822_9BURK|nr:4-hydroxythreonine-4-phosphate dehydrogenase PdxA [Candidatus Symbiobacter mobilis]AGX86413.1 4-hydroxythreonine-4-phosphate dehydrogenase [Candidatus Symbiobacter mobilis CR]